MKLSKVRYDISSSLRGLSLKHYTAVTRFKASNVIARAAKYIDRSIWMKFDRGKPMTDEQAFLLRCALNMAALELVKNYPFEIPVITLVKHPIAEASRRLGQPKASKKGVYNLTQFELLLWPSIGTPKGAVYTVLGRPFEMDGHKGKIAFATHAITRMLERLPDLNEVATKENALVPLKFLEYVTAMPVVDPATMMLKAVKYGHFPMEWCPEQQIWVCTTFLLPGYVGTKEHLSKCLEQLREKWK
jgi:hypothetical protein